MPSALRLNHARYWQATNSHPNPMVSHSQDDAFAWEVCPPFRQAATRLRATSRTALLTSRTAVLTYSMEGSVKCCQSFEPPWRTIIALVKAANVMVMAARPTHTPVRDAGELSSTERSPPVTGGRARHPPLPDDGRSVLRGDSIRGGSCTVVAMCLPHPCYLLCYLL